MLQTKQSQTIPKLFRYSAIPLFLVVLSCSGITSKSRTSSQDNNESAAANSSVQNQSGNFTPSNSDEAAPPEVVSGGYLTASCDQFDIGDAQKSAAKCSIYENDGRRYTGPIDDLSAKISFKFGATNVAGNTIRAVAGADYDFVVAVDGIGELFSVEAHFTSNGRAFTLNARIYNVQEKTSQDMSLFVSPAGSDSGSCIEGNPCATIGYTLSRLPGRIDHKVQVSIAEGAYRESVTIQEMSVGPKGQLRIIGNGEGFVINSEGKGSALNLMDVTGMVLLKNGRLIGGAKNGLNVKHCTNLLLDNMTVSGSANGAYFDAGSLVNMVGYFVTEDNSANGISLQNGSRIIGLDDPSTSRNSFELSALRNGETGVSVSNSEFWLSSSNSKFTAVDNVHYALYALERSKVSITGNAIFRATGKSAYYVVLISNYSSFNLNAKDIFLATNSRNALSVRDFSIVRLAGPTTAATTTTPAIWPKVEFAINQNSNLCHLVSVDLASFLEVFNKFQYIAPGLNTCEHKSNVDIGSSSGVRISMAGFFEDVNSSDGISNDRRSLEYIFSQSVN